MLDLKAHVEALLFGADGPLRLDRLVEVLEAERPAVDAVLKALAAEYDEQARGFFLQEVAGGYQLRTRPEFADSLRRLGRTRPKSNTCAASIPAASSKPCSTSTW
jgi:segregation and condensation protein B